MSRKSRPAGCGKQKLGTTSCSFRPSLTVFPLSTHLQHVYNYAQTRAEGDTALDLAVDMMQVWCARLGEVACCGGSPHHHPCSLSSTQTFAESAGSLSRIGITFLTSFRRSLLTLQVKLRLREKSEPGSLPDYAQVLAPLDVHTKVCMGSMG